MDDHGGRVRAWAAAGALFFDRDDRVLLVDPVYKEHLDIPGGFVEEGETPYEACVREVEEELAIRPPIGRLLVADWSPAPVLGQRVLFVFDGGVLDEATFARIVFADGELRACAYHAADELDALTVDRLAVRIRAALVAKARGETVYLEHGRPVTVR
ncbi:NUDIX hydrolase [Spongiactinospora sp. TRM90649]|uniref:NUDIX domain-containing protein n=1 Tax=Spongiactinospora sp. TRM90649 TaxID=3031114 RepID=UPI0023F7C68F|nr:NUDIX hydrolase [Spongiactinospora sp. TRM90649]MDF5751169.1 NUDIX hydrolase [Spongiactinospora sp. TRM90649]